MRFFTRFFSLTRILIELIFSLLTTYIIILLTYFYYFFLPPYAELFRVRILRTAVILDNIIVLRDCFAPPSR